MDADELFLLEALVALLPYVIVSTANWVNHKVSTRYFGDNAPV